MLAIVVFFSIGEVSRSAALGLLTSALKSAFEIGIKLTSGSVLAHEIL
jgi:hypothetical protein